MSAAKKKRKPEVPRRLPVVPAQAAAACADPVHELAAPALEEAVPELVEDGADACPITWADVCRVAESIDIVACAGPDSPGNVWAAIKTIRATIVAGAPAREMMRAEIRALDRNQGTDAMDIAIAWLVEIGDIELTRPGAYARTSSSAPTESEPSSGPRLGVERTVRAGDIRYDEAVNVRGVDVIALAKRRPVEGTAEWNEVMADLECELGDLIKLIPAQGILEPPVCVLDADGTPRLIAGYRRLATVFAVWGPEALIKVNVVDEADAAEIEAINLAENTGRKKVTKWKVIDKCWRLYMVHKWGADKIAERSGISTGYVENFLRVKRKLSPTVWESWVRWCESGSRHGEGSIGVEFIFSLLIYPQADQVARWEARMMGKSYKAPKPEGEESDGPSKPDVPKVRTASDLRMLLVRTKIGPSNPTPTEIAYNNGARMALEAALGGNWKGYDPPKVTKPKAEAKPKPNGRAKPKGKARR